MTHYFNPYFNYFRLETLYAILQALRPLPKDLKEEIIDLIRISITETRDFYEFEDRDFDGPFY